MKSSTDELNEVSRKAEFEHTWALCQIFAHYYAYD